MRYVQIGALFDVYFDLDIAQRIGRAGVDVIEIDVRVTPSIIYGANEEFAFENLQTAEPASPRTASRMDL